MPDPRRHHYVPQFYLRRFTDEREGFWVWDKKEDRVFRASPTSIAVETDFYKIHDFVPLGHDPYLMEKQLGGIEDETSMITGQWINWLREINPLERIEIPAINRQIVARFIALQYLRTADTREILGAIYQRDNPDKPFDDEEASKLHTTALWNLDLVNGLAAHIEKAIWVFARNPTETPYVTSDNPVAFRTYDNRQWLRLGFRGVTYAVYALSPDIVMYCFDRDYSKGLPKLDQCLSPVILTDEMIQSENSGQVFMANRFLISPSNEFQHARNFAATIGTDIYAAEKQSD